MHKDQAWTKDEVCAFTLIATFIIAAVFFEFDSHDMVSGGTLQNW